MASVSIPSDSIFVDSSAFKAWVDKDDDFSELARVFLENIDPTKTPLITTNFILDEIYTLLRVRLGVKAAVKLSQDIKNSTTSISVVRVTAQDEEDAWKYFINLPGRGTSYTDCTCFAVMKRLGLKEAFTFDRGFAKAGFKVLP